jgi:hypothetical protein
MGRLTLQRRRATARGLSARTAKAWINRRFYGIGNRATLTTSMAGADNDLLFYAKAPGTAGNSTRVRIVVAGANTPLSVAVAGQDITVNSATNGSSAATSTASQVVDAVRRDLTARTLVHAQVAPQNTGDGVVAALAYTNLAGAV